MRAILASVVLGLASMGTVHAGDVPGGSLRIATYNSYLLSPLFKCPPIAGVMPECLGQIEGETEQWAERLASEILDHHAELDVIVLNEVWDEDAKKILADRLKTQYPNQVRNIDAPLLTIRASAFQGGVNGQVEAIPKGEDSGLMLFAKDDFEFAALPGNRHRWPPDAASELDATTPHVAFVLFEACGDFDCLSAKGAAMVRLRHKASGQIHNVVLTHLQADYPDDGNFFADARLKQLQAVRDLIEQTHPQLPGRLMDGRETLFFLGDLNVPYLNDRTEWNARFTQGYFADAMYEAAHFTGSDRDLLATNETDRERLDYILAAPTPWKTGSKHTCVQHVTYPREFRALESDHFMVHASIQSGFDYCSPSIARPIVLGTGTQGVTVDLEGGRDVTRIHAPDALQWFLVDAGEGGTFSIGRDGDDVRVEVYLPEDLTTPVSRYNKTLGTKPPGCIRQCFAVDKFVLPGRFYVRVRGALRTTTADYALHVRRHTCATREDACILMPGATGVARLSSAETPAPSRQDEAWFRFHVVGNATSGKAQTVKFTPSGLGSQVTAALVGLDLAAGSGSPRTAANGAISLRAGSGSDGYLRIRQSVPAPGQERRITVDYSSNLRFLTVGALVCRDETNPELGSDDMFTRFHVDGAGRRAPGAGTVSFDCNDSADTEDWAAMVGDKELRYLKRLGVQLLEGDDTSADDASNRFYVEDVPSGRSGYDGMLKWGFSDGRYEFHYRLDRYPNRPVED